MGKWLSTDDAEFLNERHSFGPASRLRKFRGWPLADYEPPTIRSVSSSISRRACSEPDRAGGGPPASNNCCESRALRDTRRQVDTRRPEGHRRVPIRSRDVRSQLGGKRQDPAKRAGPARHRPDDRLVIGIVLDLRHRVGIIREPVDHPDPLETGDHHGTIVGPGIGSPR